MAINNPAILKSGNVTHRMKNRNSIAQAIQQQLGRKGSQQSFLLGRKNLAKNYKSVGHSKERQQKEIHSAALPDIGSALNPFKKNNLVTQEKSKERKIEYIHEEQYDTQSKQKWTFFNKHALEVCESDEETEELKFMEDSIIEQMKLDEQNTKSHYCSIPMETWQALYEAKCQDLGIPCKMDK